MDAALEAPEAVVDRPPDRTTAAQNRSSPPSVTADGDPGQARPSSTPQRRQMDRQTRPRSERRRHDAVATDDPRPRGRAAEDVATEATDTSPRTPTTSPKSPRHRTTPARTTPPALPGYQRMTLAQVRGHLRELNVGEVTALLQYEQSADNRAPFLTLLSNRLVTLDAQPREQRRPHRETDSRPSATPAKAGDTSRENPWPVRALAQRMTEYVAGHLPRGSRASGPGVDAVRVADVVPDAARPVGLDVAAGGLLSHHADVRSRRRWPRAPEWWCTASSSSTPRAAR